MQYWSSRDLQWKEVGVSPSKRRKLNRILLPVFAAVSTLFVSLVVAAAVSGSSRQKDVFARWGFGLGAVDAVLIGILIAQNHRTDRGELLAGGQSHVPPQN